MDINFELYDIENKKVIFTTKGVPNEIAESF